MKTVVAPNILVSAVDMVADITSSVINILQQDVCSIQINYTSAHTPVGVIYIQGSLDQSNWVNLYFDVNGSTASSIVVPTDTSPIIVDIDGTAIPYLRVFYDRTSGGSADAMTVYVSMKRIGD